jgi:CSLREA domain-containing protein
MRSILSLPAPALVLAVSLATVASAATFTVDDFGDAVDANAGDATCQTATASCTLRAAIQEANAHAGPDVIEVPAGTVMLAIAGQAEDAAATGDLDVTDDLTVTGAGAGTTTIDAAGLDRVFDVWSTFSLSAVTVRGGDPGAGAEGGAIFSAPEFDPITVTIDQVHFDTNRANHGGAILNELDSELTITGSSFSGNAAPFGGAIENRSDSASLENVTISGNSSEGDAVRNAVSLALRSVTLQGDLVTSTGNLSARNTIFDAMPACGGSTVVTSNGSNIDRGTSCGLGGAGDLSDTDSLLLPLADNGGGTLTHALDTGSPAIDGAATCPASGVDQRGVTRPIDGDENGSELCDVGAYELDPAAPPTTTTTVFGTTTTTTLPTGCPSGPTFESTTCRVGELRTDFVGAATPGKQSDKTARLLDKAADRLVRTQEALAIEKTKKAVRQAGKAGKFVRKFGKKVGSAKKGPKLVADEATRADLRDDALGLEADLFLLRDSLR